MTTTRISNCNFFVAASILSFACLTAIAQDYRILHHFTGGTNDGAQPYGLLVQSGATLYGMTYLGGSNNLGTIFRINSDGTGFQVLHSFVSASSDGQKPIGSLVLSGSTLYGMATSEGTSYGGTVFQIQIDGSGFGVLRQFSGTDGKWSYGDLIQSGGMLYGLNNYGGSSTGSGWVGNGTLFQIDTNGTSFQVLRTFAGKPGDGALPHGTLAGAGSFLYGMTTIGGSSDFGTVFKINTNGSGYQLLRSFTGGASDGKWPGRGALTPSGAILYGMTSAGGSSGNGILFKISTNGSGFALVHSFNGGSADGAAPVSALVQRGTMLYGMTAAGGSSGNGTIFQINTNGTGFRLLHSFAGGSDDGAAPMGAALLSGWTLFGMTQEGGSQSNGVIFAIDLPRPALAMSISNTNVILSWNTNYPDFALESAGQLINAWTPVPGVTGYSATLPFNIGTNQFFRLRQ
jgi:uncharacterized repeat protein (TIGR03803 family)